MGPEGKDPLDPSIDLHIVQLSSEGAVGATGPRIHPHGHRPLSEWLNVAAYKGSQEVHACQPIL
jgi:hypothetical protein